jgi:chorismate dehydratase
MLKVGALSFVNSLPFFYPFFEKKVFSSASFQVGIPTEINHLLATSQLDVALISSASFVARRKEYVLLTNYGIGSTKQVGSVCLYTKRPVEELEVIAVPSMSATSVMLLRVLSDSLWKIAPRFVEYHKSASLYELFDTYDAILMIGDDCLTTRIPPNYQVVDLCTAWFHWTKKPFIFAVFATRYDRWVALEEEIREFHYALAEAYRYSETHIHEVIAYARQKTGISSRALRSYFLQLEYDLHTEHFHGLEHFAQLAKRYFPDECLLKTES